jgi:hypothetical protein
MPYLGESLLSELSYRINQRRFALFANSPNRALQRRSDFSGIFNGAFGIPVERLCQLGKIRRRMIDLQSDRRTLHRVASLLRQSDLMRPIVVIAAIVVHDHEQRNMIVSGGPQPAWIKHEIAVRLNVDDQLSAAPMSQSNPKGYPQISSSSQTLTAMLLWPCERPKPSCPTI